MHTHYAYSFDGESYSGGADNATIEDALIEARSESGEGEYSIVFVGEATYFKPQADADSIIDMLADRAGDECGEFADDWLGNISVEAKTELETMVAVWAEANDKPTFFSVTNAKKYHLDTGIEILHSSISI